MQEVTERRKQIKKARVSVLGTLALFAVGVGMILGTTDLFKANIVPISLVMVGVIVVLIMVGVALATFGGRTASRS